MLKNKLKKIKEWNIFQFTPRSRKPVFICHQEHSKLTPSFQTWMIKNNLFEIIWKFWYWM